MRSSSYADRMGEIYTHLEAVSLVLLQGHLEKLTMPLALRLSEALGVFA